MIPFKKLFHLISLTSLSLFLISCGEEGSGNFNVKGSGTSVSSQTLLSSFDDEFTESFSEVSTLVASTNPLSLELKVFEILVSPNQDCSEAVRVMHNLSPSYQNILGSVRPTLGQGEIKGVFPCVVLVASDTMYFTPETTLGSCTSGTRTSLEVCRTASPESINYPDSSFYSTGVGNVESTCANGEQLIPIYLTTLSSNNGDNASNAFSPPTTTDTARGVTLGAPLVIEGEKTGYFVVNGEGKVQDNSGCDMQPPRFSFE